MVPRFRGADVWTPAFAGVTAFPAFYEIILFDSTHIPFWFVGGSMIYKGRAWKFGANVDTDAIIPARYLNTTDPKEMASHLMEDVDPTFLEKIQPGDILVAEDNFGCGSSREHAPLAIKHAGLSCVVAKSFARIFYRNAFNMGLPILESPEAVGEIRQGDELEIDSEKGTIQNLTTGQNYRAQPIPPFMQQLIEAGGLMNFVKKFKMKNE
jgi:3-isopropylmalate dehydratase small subunit